MSGFWDLTVLADYYETVCVGIDGDSAIAKFFVVYDFWPVFLSFVIIGITLVQYEYIYFLFTIVMLVDGAINYGAQKAVGASDNLQPPTCPIEPNQMPALASERIMVIYIVGWFLVTFVYPRPMSTTKIFMFNIAGVLALYARFYLVFSTPAQMLAGAAIGFAEGMAFGYLFWNLRKRGWDKRLIESPSILGLPPLTDTLAYPRSPTYVVEQEPDDVNVKVDPNPLMNYTHGYL